MDGELGIPDLNFLSLEVNRTIQSRGWQTRRRTVLTDRQRDMPSGGSETAGRGGLDSNQLQQVGLRVYRVCNSYTMKRRRHAWT